MSRFIFLVLWAVFVNCTYAKNIVNVTDSEVIARQTGFCPSNKFRCNNGQCIDRNLVCDGYKNCRDGSDENKSVCYYSPGNHQKESTTSKIPSGYEVYPLINQEPETPVKCPPWQFSCSNGNCVSTSVTCNGYDECGDGSDEATRLCSPNTHQPSKNRPTHPQRPTSKPPKNQEPEFSCKVGEFLCRSGECVNGSFVCNRRRDCRDGSDEADSICPDDVKPSSTTRRPNYQENGGNEQGWGSKSLTPCRVPPQPQNGYWRVHKSLCATGRECELPAAVRSMEPGSYLVYYCNNGFSLNGTQDVLCGPGGVWVHEPKCDEIKCKDLSTSSREALCLWNNLAVSCEIPVSIGTTAQLQCRQGFDLDISVSSTYKNVTCKDNGEWYPKPIQCARKAKKVKLVLEGDLYMKDE